jgi:hypothetical protein
MVSKLLVEHRYAPKARRYNEQHPPLHTVKHGTAALATQTRTTFQLGNGQLIREVATACGRQASGQLWNRHPSRA